MPLSRGERLVSCALGTHGQRAPPSAGATPADDGDGDDGESVELSSPVAGLTRVPCWETLARQQANQITEEVLRESQTGSIFALDDRNLVSMPWRRVFVVRDGPDFVLLDTNGVLIEEPHDGVAAGRQAVDELIDEFSVDGYYYRPGKLARNPPSRERTRQDGEQVATRNVHGTTRATSPVLLGSGRTIGPLTELRRSDSERASGEKAADPLESLQAASAEKFGSSESDPALLSLECMPSNGTAEQAPADASHLDVPMQPAESSPAAATDANGEVEVESELPSAVVNETEVAGEGVEQQQQQQPQHEQQGAAATPTIAEDARIDEPSPAIQPADSSEEPVVHWAVCDRVCLSPPLVATQVSGMIASVGIGMQSILIATDDGKWVTASKEDEGMALSREETSQGAENCVVALTFDHYSKQVSGMLLGAMSEMVLQGQINAYMAHILRTQERDPRLRDLEPSLRYANQSFAFGDIVVQLPETGSAKLAAVVRVLYSRRTGNQQARKMLILSEVSQRDNTFVLPGTKEFFPASWVNWTVKTKPISNDNMTLTAQSMRELEKAYKATKKKDMHCMTSVSNAAKFAGVNKTPSQLAALAAEKEAEMERIAAEKEAAKKKSAAAVKEAKKKEAAKEKALDANLAAKRTPGTKGDVISCSDYQDDDAGFQNLSDDDFIPPSSTSDTSSRMFCNKEARTDGAGAASKQINICGSACSDKSASGRHVSCRHGLQATNAVLGSPPAVCGLNSLHQYGLAEEGAAHKPQNSMASPWQPGMMPQKPSEIGVERQGALDHNTPQTGGGRGESQGSFQCGPGLSGVQRQWASSPATSGPSPMEFAHSQMQCAQMPMQFLQLPMGMGGMGMNNLGMGIPDQGAMVRAELARVTQERLENERAARIREAQLRAWYGMPPM